MTDSLHRLRRVDVRRYVTPLREGGSMPAVVEAGDLALYVPRFHGAGPGVRALVAEIARGGRARALGLPVPGIVLATLGPLLAHLIDRRMHPIPARAPLDRMEASRP